MQLATADDSSLASNHPPNAIITEQKRRADTLRSDLALLQQSLAKNSKSIDQTMTAAIKFLPTSMLPDKANNPVKLRQRNAALARALLIYRPYHARLLLRKFHYWLRIIFEQKEALADEKRRVAAKVQSSAMAVVSVFGKYCRGFVARRRVRKLRRAVGLAREREREWRERRLMSEEEKWVRRVDPSLILRAGIKIQCRVRTIIAKKRYHAMVVRRQHEAAFCIAAFVRRRQLYRRRLALAARERAALERRSATAIQCTVRRHQSHQAVARQRVLYRRRLYLKVFEDDEKVIQFYFTQNGAALRIQRWYLTLPWRKTLVLQRKKDRWRGKHPLPVVVKERPKSAMQAVGSAMKGLASGMNMVSSLVRSGGNLGVGGGSEGGSRPVSPGGEGAKKGGFMSQVLATAQHLGAQAMMGVFGRTYTEEEVALAGRLLTRIGRGYLGRCRARRRRAERAYLNHLARVIQCCVRCHLSRGELEFRRRRQYQGPKAARVIQQLWWRTLFKWHKQSTFYRERLRNELFTIALMQSNKTLHYQHIDFAWSGAKKVRQTDAPQLELQRLFSSYATQGMIDISGLLKLVKDCLGLLDKKVFTTKMVELQFSKIKDVKEKRLSYARFLELIANLSAIKFLGVDPTLVGSYTGVMDPFATDTYAYKHLHIAGRGKYRSDGASGAGGAGGAGRILVFY